MIYTNKYRSTDCGGLRLSNVNEDVTLSGFVDTIRKLGGITFVVLRDFYGKTQIVVPDELGIELNKEDNICPDSYRAPYSIGRSILRIRDVGLNNLWFKD